MKINFACACGKRLQVDSEAAGKKGKCPQCGNILTIPSTIDVDLFATSTAATPAAATPTVATPGAATSVAATSVAATSVAATSVAATSVAAEPIQTRKYAVGVRPWVRFWARQLDVLAFGILFGILVGIIGLAAPQLIPAIPSEYELFYGVVVTLVWVFVESLLLCTVGTTPGKWLLKTQVTKTDSTPITYRDAFDRSRLVWFRGMGLGLPLVPLFTMTRGQEQLVSRGITSWDVESGFVVRHEKIGAIRIATTVVLFGLGFFLIALGKQAERERTAEQIGQMLPAARLTAKSQATESLLEFDTSGHKNARGIKMRISYPSSWTAMEGESDNATIQKFVSDGGQGNQGVIVQTFTLAAPFDGELSEEEKRVLLARDKMQERLGKEITILSHEITKIDGKTCAMVELEQLVSEGGLKVRYKSLCFNVPYNGVHLAIFCYDFQDATRGPDAIRKEYETAKPIFKQIAMSARFLDN